MTTFGDLSESEILALTDDQVSFYIDLECARKGVGLLPPQPGPEPAPAQPSQDVVLFEVGGFHFATVEQAEEVAKLANSFQRYKTDYAPGGDYRNRIVNKDDSPVAVSTSREYSPEEWDRVRKAVTTANEAKARWQRATSDYREASEKRGEAAGWINQAVSDAHENEALRVRILAEFERYVVLASGDRVMARKFMLDANPDAAKFVPEEAPVAS